jgi:hypothetical protein
MVVAGDGKAQSRDGTATDCSFSHPQGIAVDEKTHACFVADSGSSRIRKISFVDWLQLIISHFHSPPSFNKKEQIR